MRILDEFKTKNVLNPLTQALVKGGRFIGVYSAGNDPGLEIIKKIWLNENPLIATREVLRKHGEHWLNDEFHTISRKMD